MSPPNSGVYSRKCIECSGAIVFLHEAFMKKLIVFDIHLENPL